MGRSGFDCLMKIAIAENKFALWVKCTSIAVITELAYLDKRRGYRGQAALIPGA